MKKAILCSFAIACLVGFVGISPMTAFAAQTNAEWSTLTETNTNKNEKRAAIEEKMNKANEKWKTLTTKQKDEIYILLDDKMQVDNKLMDKLVEFGVLDKEDVVIFKAFMLEKVNRVKESGEFPLLRKIGNNRNK